MTFNIIYCKVSWPIKESILTPVALMLKTNFIVRLWIPNVHIHIYKKANIRFAASDFEWKKKSDKANFCIPFTTGIIYFEINCKLILAYAWMLIQNYFCNIFISCSISRITYEQSKHIVGTFLWRQKQI